MENLDLEKLHETLMKVTNGKEIIPTFESWNIPDAFAPIEYLDSTEGKIDRILNGYLDFDDNDLITPETSKVSGLETAEKKYIVSQKKLSNLKITLAQIEAKIISLKDEQSKILETILKSGGLNNELQKQGQEIQETKHKYEYLNEILTSYEKKLFKDSKYYESSYQEKFRKILGEQIRQVRTSKKITLEELAEMVGLKRLSMWKYENAVGDPTSFTLYRLCKVLNVTPNYLMNV